MITDIQNEIVGLLGAAIPYITVGSWQGDIESLRMNPAALPTVQVIYGGTQYKTKQVIGSNRIDMVLTWQVFILAQNLQSRDDAAGDAMSLVEAVQNALTGTTVQTTMVLWPVENELLLAENGMIMYGLKFAVDVHT